MASARSVLAALGVLQLLSVACNFWSPLLAYMLPVALLASAILWISIYYNWKRGVELFIFLSAVLFIMALCPFLSVLIHRRAAERWHDVLWYSIEMVVESTCIAASIWVLYHTDYSPKPERQSLLSQAGDSFSNVRDAVKDRFSGNFQRGEGVSVRHSQSPA